MKKTLMILLIFIVMTGVSCSSGKSAQKRDSVESGKERSVSADDKKSSYNYPSTEKRDYSYTIHGEEIEDPYTWLEDSEDSEVIKWTEAQNEFTEKTVFSWSETKKFKKRLSELYRYDSMSTPVKRNNRIFYSFKKGLQNQPVYYVEEGEEKRELVNPNELSEDGTTAMDWVYVSPEGNYIAYGLSEHGSEQSVLHIMDVETGEKVDEPITGCRYASVGWLPDESGFYYTRKLDGDNQKEIDEKQSIRFHEIGTDPEEDEIIAESDIPEAIFVSTIDNEGKWLVIAQYKGSSRRPRLWLYDIENEEKRDVVDNYEHMYEPLVHDGYIYLRTNRDGALNWKIDRVDCETLEWETFIPENDKDILDGFTVGADMIYLKYMRDVASRLVAVNTGSGKREDVELPVLGTIFSLSTDPNSRELFLKFSSYAYPPTIFKYDMKAIDKVEASSAEAPPSVEEPEYKLSKFWQAELPVETDSLKIEQIFYSSKDGTKVPMFVVYKKGLEKNGENHTMVKGYGGFNVTYPMYFSSTNYAWIETGGILVIANIRGGGEYGSEWHKAGMMHNKQNTFDDFAWALKHLIKENYTSPEKIAIWGGSNGGLLTGAMITQYPELFKAALVAVPLLDMLKFHKFLIGRYWTSEYGNPDKKEDFDYIKKYSPYHNIEDGGEYPAVMLTAGDHDSRVHPFHAKKMTARLREKNSSDNPILLWVERKAGHGQGKPTEARINEAAMQIGFFLRMLNVEN